MPRTHPGRPCEDIVRRLSASQGERAHQEPANCDGTLILDLAARTVRPKSLLFKPPGLLLRDGSQPQSAQAADKIASAG